MKSNFFIINLVIYPLELMVSIGQDDKQLCKILTKRNLHTDPAWKYELNDGARFCIFDNNDGLIRLKEVPKTPEQIGFLNHEITHYVLNIMDIIGMKWNAGSDEAYCYLVQYISQEIHKRLK